MLSVSDNVKITFGPLGKYFVINNYEDCPIITKDGVTVAKYIDYKSRKDSLGVKLLSSISNSTNKYAGDGTTTSTVLAGQLIKRGNYLVNNGYDASKIKEGIYSNSKFNFRKNRII